MKKVLASVVISLLALFVFISCDGLFSTTFTPTLEGRVDATGCNFDITNYEDSKNPFGDQQLYTLHYKLGAYTTVPESGDVAVEILQCPNGHFGRNFYNKGTYTFWVVAHNPDGSNKSAPSNLIVLTF